MPNSAWTETGSSVSVGTSTTTIDTGSAVSSPNYLTTADKITLINQYAAELATKTQLDTLASTWSVSSSAYDSSVASINTTLVNAGAPSNWATTWPDGTVFGPVMGVKTLLASAWSSIASARSSLQAAISASQASAAQAAAIAAAATDATSKMNSAISSATSAAESYAATVAANAQTAATLASQPHQVSWASTALPALPSSSYPAGYFALTTDKLIYQVNTAGTAWVQVQYAASGIYGQLTAGQLAAGAVTAGTIAAGAVTTSTLAASAVTASNIAAGAVTSSKLTLTDTTNICQNPSGTSGIDNWSGTISSVYANGSYGTAAGEYCLVTGNRDANYGSTFPVSQGQTFAFSVDCCPGAYYSGLGSAPQGGFQVGLQLFSDNGITTFNWMGTAGAATSQAGWATVTGQLTVPSGVKYARIWVQINAAAGSTGSWAFKNLIVRKAASAELLVDGTITGSKISAGAITGDMITAGSLTANVIYFSDGFCLNTLEPKEAGADKTLSHITSSIVNKGTSWSVPSSRTLVPGMSWTVSSTGTSEVFSLLASIVLQVSNLSSASVAVVAIGLVVDGNTSSPHREMQYLAGGIASTTVGVNLCFFDSVTGLSAGTHTLQLCAFYMSANGVSMSSATTAQLQAIY